MRNTASLIALAAAAVSLGACNTAESLNAMFDNQQTVEQFAHKGNQLALPPDFDLRPPAGGGDEAKAQITQVQGQRIVTGSSGSGGVITAATGQSDGEAALLEEAGVRSGIDNRVRQQVDSESQAATEGQKQFTEKLLTWEDDGAEEREDDRLGKPVIRKKGEVF